MELTRENKLGFSSNILLYYYIYHFVSFVVFSVYNIICSTLVSSKGCGGLHTSGTRDSKMNLQTQHRQLQQRASNDISIIQYT